MGRVKVRRRRKLPLKVFWVSSYVATTAADSTSYNSIDVRGFQSLSDVLLLSHKLVRARLGAAMGEIDDIIFPCNLPQL